MSRSGGCWVCAFVLGLAPGFGVVQAAQLQPETVSAWDAYVETVKAGVSAHCERNRFLWTDQDAERLRQVRAGEIAIAPAGSRSPQRVPDGLIHHWIGAAFLPGATVNEVFAIVRDYGRYQEFYRPAVVSSKTLAKTGGGDRFTMVVMNGVLFAQRAVDSDYQGRYVQLDPNRWYGITYTTRVQEIENYGEPSECRLPAGIGSGYIWRLFSVTRFEERDGGVYLELEAIALSRGIPPQFAWLVHPIVRHFARNSLLTSLEQTRQAVDSAVRLARRPDLAHSGRSILNPPALAVPK